MRFSSRACSVDTDRFGCVQRGDGQNIHIVVHSAAEGTTDRVTLGARGCRRWEVNRFRACVSPAGPRTGDIGMSSAWRPLPSLGGRPRSSSKRRSRLVTTRSTVATRCRAWPSARPRPRFPHPHHQANRAAHSRQATSEPGTGPPAVCPVARISTLVRSPAVKRAFSWCVSATLSRHGSWFVRTGPCAFSRARSRRGWCSQPLPLPSAGTLDRATPAILCLVEAHGWPVVTGRADREQGQAHLPAKQP